MANPTAIPTPMLAPELRLGPCATAASVLAVQAAGELETVALVVAAPEVAAAVIVVAWMPQASPVADGTHVTAGVALTFVTSIQPLST